MDVHNFLKEVEGLSHSERVVRMVHLGRDAVDDQSARTLITQLWKGNKYEEYLALYTCHGTRDVSFAMGTVKGQSKLLKSLAMRLIVLLGTNEQALEVAMELPTTLQMRFIKHLRKRKVERRRETSQPSIVDQLIGKLEASNDPSIIQKQLLPMASESLFRRLLPSYIDQFDTGEWQQFVKYYPVIAYEHILPWVDQAKDATQLLGNTIDRLLRRLAAEDSTVDMAVAMFGKMLPIMIPSALTTERLMRWRPTQVVQHILDRQIHVSCRLDKFYKKLPISQLVQLFQMTTNTVYRPLLRQMSPEQREVICCEHRGLWQMQNGAIKYEKLYYFPRHLQLEEARRSMDIAKDLVNDEEMVRLASLLPWDEAMVLQEKPLQSNVATVRQQVLQHQIRSVKYQKERLGDALTLVMRHKEEPDVVREGIYKSLRWVRPSSWKEEHLGDLATIISDAIKSMETSDITVQRLADVVADVGMYHPIWAASKIKFLMEERERFPSGPYPIAGHTPTKTAMEHLVKAVHPVIQSWHEKERYECIRNFAETLDYSKRYYPQLMDALQSALDKEKDWNSVSCMVSLLLRENPKRTRDFIVPKIAKDPTWMTFIQFRKLVMTKETQILADHSLLEAKEFNGNFPLGPLSLWLFTEGYHHWTKAQQEKYAGTLVSLIRNPEAPDSSRAANMKKLSGLCFTDSKNVLQFANDPKALVKYVALGWATRLDSSDCIPTLLKTCQDDRAHLAMYSLRRHIERIPKPDALHALKQIPFTKPRIAKAVIRHVASLKTDEAYAYLVHLNTLPLHVDARITLNSSLIRFPNAPSTWTILNAAASSPDHKLASSIAKLSTEGLPRSSLADFSALFSTLLMHPDVRVQYSALHNLSVEKMPSYPTPLAQAIIAALQSPDHAVAECAANTIFRSHALTKYPGAIAAAFEKPHSRRHLSTIGNPAVDCLRHYRKECVETTLAIVRALERDELTLVWRVSFITKCLPWPQNLRELRALAGSGAWHHDAMKHALVEMRFVDNFKDGNAEMLEQWLSGRAVRRECRERHEDKLGRVYKGEGEGAQCDTATDKDNLEDLTPYGGTTSTPTLRRLGLAALEGLAASPWGWTEEFRRRLDLYRNDESAWIREAACFVALPGEGFQDVSGRDGPIVSGGRDGGRDRERGEGRAVVHAGGGGEEIFVEREKGRRASGSRGRAEGWTVVERGELD
ncbi:MAG: hypothetical protein MMC23_004663 [Stictis urceolatum]|nr:hypothetical protein [Stictis urceolata]